MEKTILEHQQEIFAICKQFPVLQERLIAFIMAGYTAKYMYTRSNQTYGTTITLNRKQVYRIQVSYTELKKSYKSAWCIDIPFNNVLEIDYNNLPF